MSSNYYEVLGVSADATADQIKKAYRRLARELHPDVATGPGAEERFKDVSRAYEVLSNPEKRQMYDRGVDPTAPGGGGAGGPGGRAADPGPAGRRAVAAHPARILERYRATARTEAMVPA